MNVTISLSMERLTEVLMAHSAAVGGWTGETDKVLTARQKPMLQVLADGEISRLALEIPGIIENVETDGDMRLLSCVLDAGSCVRVWRRNIETAVCAGVMARVTENADNGCAEMYCRDRAGIVESMKREAVNFFLPDRIRRGA